jgi:hypothetical protein
MLECVSKVFPRFAALAPRFHLENIQPALSLVEIAGLEKQLGLALPRSYKQLLGCAGGFWLIGGAVQFARPFLHAFQPLNRLSTPQQRTVKLKGGAWPPPTNGMLCFAEFWMEADGDQVLFDVHHSSVDAEYPVIYYAHESRPPSIRLVAGTFAEFMETFLDYPAFSSAS